jgi:hypothetical protein
MKDKVSFLGHIISAEGISPNPKKVEAVRGIKPPTTVTEVKSFLGMAGYYRKFIKKFSTIAEPITELTKLGVEFHWSDECQKAFDHLKKALTTSPILAHPDFSKPFEIHTDASGVGIGAVLTQHQEGKERAIWYASRKLTTAESKWSTREVEALAILWACELFRPYIIERPFIVRTDHESLKWLMTVQGQGRLARWALRLQEYEVKLEHRAGKKNANADELSRHPLEVDEEAERDREERAENRYHAFLTKISTSGSDLESPRLTHFGKVIQQYQTVILPRRVDIEDILTQSRIQGLRQKRLSLYVLQTEAHDPSPSDPIHHSEINDNFGEGKDDEVICECDEGCDGVEPLEAVQDQKDSDPMVMGDQIQTTGVTSVPDVDLHLPKKRDLREVQLEDPLWGPLMEQLEQLTTTRWPSRSQQEKKETQRMINSKKYLITGGVLKYLFQEKQKPRVVIPQCMVNYCTSCIRYAHDVPMSGHLGNRKTIRRLLGKVFWKGLKRDVLRWIRACPKCQARKTGKNNLSGLLQPQFVAEPWHTVAMDLSAKLPKTEKGNQYVMVMMDSFLGWVELAAIPNKSAKEVAQALWKNIYLRHGIPKRLLSDQGGEFDNELMKRLASRVGTEQVFTSAYHPSGNGQVERFNRVLFTTLSMYVNENRDDWDDHLESVAFAYNTSKIGETDMSPFTLLYGREPRTPVEVLIDKDESIFDYEQYGFKLTSQLLETYRSLRKFKREEKGKMKAYFDKRRKEAEYVKGDKVLIFWPRRSLGPGAKLTAEWLGPWKVVRKAGPVDYWVRWTNGTEERVHVTRMKPYIEGTSCTAASTELIQDIPENQDLPEEESEKIMTSQESQKEIEEAKRQEEKDDQLFDSIDWKVGQLHASRMVDGKREFLVSWKTIELETVPNSKRWTERISRATRVRVEGGSKTVYRLFWKQTWEKEELISVMASDLVEKWNRTHKYGNVRQKKK